MTVTCRFLENLSLGALIAPVTEQEFRESYWERKPLIVHRNDAGYYGDLFTLRDFDDAVARAPNYVKTADAAVRADTNARKGTTYKLPTVRGFEAILAEMRDGGSLILEQLQHSDPKLKQLCGILGQQLSHTFEAVLYLTPPYGKSSVPHWDNTDVFILQLLGSKEWRIERDRRLFPIRPYRMGDEGRELRSEVISVTIKHGDVAYIPRGFIHVAECGAEASLHISLGVVPVVLEEFLHAAITAAVHRDERLRAALPLGFMHGHGEAIVSDAMAVLREMTDASYLGSVLDQFRDELVQKAPLDISGQVFDFFNSVPLRLDDKLEPRRSVVYRVHNGDDTVRLQVGSRSINFPNLFGRALEFALSTESFSVREIPGDLGDEEKVAFATRLMEEGLILRRPGP